MTTHKSKKKKTAAKTPGVPIPIKWNISDDIITRYASNMVVQLLENEIFKVSFFEINPDITFDIEGKFPEAVQANCVASVIISPNKLPGFIKVLQMQLDMYKEIKSSSDLKTSSNES
ncbi:MAG: hypothetical protein KKF00_10525 [Proteobacteria bacterium]|nr:hypothetical protein [Pseudomonadota bacterium]